MPGSYTSSAPLIEDKASYENHVETHLLTASSLAEGKRDMQIMQCNIMSGEAACDSPYQHHHHHHQPTQRL